MSAILSVLKSIWLSFKASFNPPGKERPSSPEIYRIPDHPWTAQEVSYTDDQYHKRIKREALFPSFGEDPEVWFAEIADTNSEDPVFDAGNHCECLRPLSDADRISLCDWIEDQWVKSSGLLAALVIYKVPDGGLISHRVHNISRDAEGRVWKFQGDNNAGIADQAPGRDNQIHSLIGKIVY
jgi:hypothetical protein